MITSRDGKGRRYATVAVLLTWAIVAAGSLMFLPAYSALAIISAVTVVLLVVDILLNRIIPRMALRNSVRRPAMTALVIGGLMIGTAAISSSFVINDTLDNMIVQQAGRAFGEVDLTVASPGGFSYYDEGMLGPLTDSIRGVEGVTAAHSLIVDQVAAQNSRTGLGAPRPPEAATAAGPGRPERR